MIRTRSLRRSERLGYHKIGELQPTECTCDKCVAMCSRFPCMGTPRAIQKIIDAGLDGHLMAMEKYYRPLKEDGILVLMPAVVNEYNWSRLFNWHKFSSGTCVFFHANRCLIHDLKPEEGSLSNHDSDGPFQEEHWDAIISTWRGHRGRSIVQKWMNKYNVTLTRKDPDE